MIFIFVAPTGAAFGAKNRIFCELSRNLEQNSKSWGPGYQKSRKYSKNIQKISLVPHRFEFFWRGDGLPKTRVDKTKVGGLPAATPKVENCQT